MGKRLTTGEFIKKSINIHGDKYDYSKSEYLNPKIRIKIICKKHGEFEQFPYNHLKGHDCLRCGIEMSVNKKTLTTEKFIEKAKKIHGNKYDYSEVKYNSIFNSVKIICEKHGIFNQKPNNHLQGSGCNLCGIERSADKTSLSKTKFIEISTKIHGDKYDYSEVKYVNNFTNIEIICSKHGKFIQQPNNHMSGKGCKFCANNVKHTIDDFIKKANEIHNNKYDYSKSRYKSAHIKVEINCVKHGEFNQTPANHLSTKGCPRCNISKGEKKVRNYLNNNEVKFIDQHSFNNLKYINPLRFDFYLPDHNICIEYDGIQHYEPIDYFGGINEYKKSIKKDKIKNKFCKENNIKLIRIPYYEYDNINNILKNLS